MNFGTEFLKSLFGSDKYTLKTPANTIPGKYLRELADKYIDKDFLAGYVAPEYSRDLNNIPEPLLRDALLGSQMNTGRNTDRRSLFQQALINRLNHYKPLEPHQEFSKTGTDYYRLMHPDEVVVPYRQSYNDEQLIDLVVPEKSEMRDIWED